MTRRTLIGGILGILILGMAAPDLWAADIPGAVRQAFASGRAAALDAYLPDGGRINLAIPALGINPGTYSKAQASALLRKVFSQYKTVSFSLETNPGALRGSWVVSDPATGRQKTLTVYVSIEQRDGRAMITSIRGG